MDPNNKVQPAPVTIPTRRCGTRLATVTVMTYSTAKGLSTPPVLAIRTVSRITSTPTWTQINAVYATAVVSRLSTSAYTIVME